IAVFTGQALMTAILQHRLQYQYFQRAFFEAIGIKLRKAAIKRVFLPSPKFKTYVRACKPNSFPKIS
ncbi:MAG: hypothetical protein ACFFFG_14110, partial [Candidatus Thorarchaeota archaeon]